MLWWDGHLIHGACTEKNMLNLTGAPTFCRQGRAGAHPAYFVSTPGKLGGEGGSYFGKPNERGWTWSGFGRQLAGTEGVHVGLNIESTSTKWLNPIKFSRISWI